VGVNWGGAVVLRITPITTTVCEPNDLCSLRCMCVVFSRYQGVVTYTSPVEAFATGIKNFDR